MAEPVQGISAVPDEGNARYFHVIVAGPKDVSLTLYSTILNVLVVMLLYMYNTTLLYHNTVLVW